MTEMERHLLKRIDSLEKTVGAILMHMGEVQAADELKYAIGHRDMELLAMGEEIPEALFSEDSDD